MFGDFLGYFHKHYFYIKTGVVILGQLLIEFGLLLITKSGHTATYLTTYPPVLLRMCKLY